MNIRGPFISPMPEAPERSPLPVFFVALGVLMLVLVAIGVAGIRASNKPQKELAELYGVSKQQISKIVRRERWTHV